jgi:hypothetical protein
MIQKNDGFGGPFDLTRPLNMVVAEYIGNCHYISRSGYFIDCQMMSGKFKNFSLDPHRYSPEN